MNFGLTERAEALRKSLSDFMHTRVEPSEELFAHQMGELGDPHGNPPILESLKEEARERGLWNLFLPHETEWTSGLSNVDYAPLAEVMGQVPFAAEVFNCSAPDTGNMELLTMFGTPEQQQRWLRPLLEGTIRSAFAMTEPAVASSDANNIQLRVEDGGDHWLLNGRKWWISGAANPRCQLLIVMGRTAPDGPRHRQQSMVLVPTSTEGVDIVRNLPVFGYVDREGHCEIVFNDVRVPKSNLLGEVGGGFAMAQARLGPGRIHHCMRTIGVAERALRLMCRRAGERFAFGSAVADKGQVQQWIADARISIDQARWYTMYTAWRMDVAGNREAATEIAGIKVAVPRMAVEVIDRAIQVHGGAGMCDDFPLAWMYAHTRMLQLADGPDEVHVRSIARRELRRQAEATAGKDDV